MHAQPTTSQQYTATVKSLPNYFTETAKQWVFLGYGVTSSFLAKALQRSSLAKINLEFIIQLMDNMCKPVYAGLE